MDEEPANLRDAQHRRSARLAGRPVAGAPTGGLQHRRARTPSVQIAGIPDDTLQIFTLGRFEVRLSSSAGQARQPRLRGAARLLLLCLLSAPGGYLAREQLMEALWPEQSIRQAQDSLRHSLAELRRILTPGEIPPEQPSSIGSDRHGIWLHLESLAIGVEGAPRIWVDDHHFEALATAALGVLGRARSASDGQTVAAARSAADEALALYRGPYLPADRQIAWVQQRRLHLLLLWAAVVRARAELAVVEKDLTHAARLCSELLQADPEDEDATGRLMCIEAVQGRRSEALRIYQRLCAHLTANVGAKPTRELQELERAIRASESLQELKLLLVRQFLPT